MSTSAITLAKSNLRQIAIARRDALPAVQRAGAATAIAARFPLTVEPGTVVSGYMPMKSELDPVPLMCKLVEAGAKLALPVVVARGTPLIFRGWTLGDTLVAGVWGTRVPRSQAPEIEPDILLVPLLAFDRSGYRLGYGAGYYDLTIAALRARKPVVAVGIAFAAQEIDAVPTTPRDARLDLVLTDNETIITNPEFR